MTIRSLLPALAVFGAFAAPVSLLAQAKVESVVVTPQGQMIASAYFSQSGLHVLTIAPKGSRVVYLHDGVEGMRFDSVTDPSHRAISSDGKRHAYTARVGTDVILVLDGKEIVRAPALNGSLTPFGFFGFSPNGKRFWYVSPAEADGVHKLVVDGVASDPTNGFDTNPIFSPDESRYAILFRKSEERRGSLLMIDGKSLGFAGDRPQFSPDGKNVVTIGRDTNTDVLLINGRPASRAPVIHSVHMSTGGLNFRVLSASRATQGVFLENGGKKIEGSDCTSIDKVIFSPDGKRYAALCNVGGTKKFVLIDGKKGQLYDLVEELQFTADSAKVIYLASSFSAGGRFLVVDDEESDGHASIQLVLGAGKRIGYIGQVQGQFTPNVVVDGKAMPVRGASYLGFSPDGSRYGFNGFVGGFLSLYLDGVEQKGVTVYETSFNDGLNKPRFRFSPDGKYVAHFGSVNGDPSKQGLVINGKLVDRAQGGIYCLPFFTPDGNHIVYFRFIPGGGYNVMVDGKAVEKFDSVPLLQNSAAPFEMGADGVFTFIGLVDGAAKRFRITPDGSTNIASMFAAVESAEAKGLADAEAATKKAADDNAKADADRVAAAAKAKADLDARTKAAQDAVVARAKAAKDAAAARLKAAADAAAAKLKK